MVWRKPIYFMWFPIKFYDLINVLWYTPVVGIKNTTKKICFIIFWPWDLNHIDVNVVYKTCTFICLIPRANVCKTVLVLSLLTTFWLSIDHCIFLSSKRFIYDNSTIIAVSYFHVELLPRSTSNHIPWTMLIGVPTM